MRRLGEVPMTRVPSPLLRPVPRPPCEHCSLSSLQCSLLLITLSFCHYAIKLSHPFFFLFPIYFQLFRNRRFDCFYDINNDWTFHGNINGTKRRLTKNNSCCKSLRAHQFQFLAFIFREQFFQRCEDVLFQ